MPAEAANTTNNPVMAVILYMVGIVAGIGSFGLEDIDIITAIVFRLVSIIALIGGLISSWKKIIAQIKEWFNIK